MCIKGKNKIYIFTQFTNGNYTKYARQRSELT